MTIEQAPGVSVSMRFRAGPRLPRRYPDGSTTYFDMVVVEPTAYAGQVRDLTVHADRSVTLGPDKSRRN